MLHFQHLIAYVLLCLVPFVAAEDDAAPPIVNKEEFNKLKGTYFVKFYSPYCPHCRSLEPKWNAAYNDVVSANLDTFQWASVNCVEQGDFCSEESVSAYPTLRVYQDGKRVYDYGNPGASQADLRSFAQAYAKKREDAFSKEYETAPKQEEQLEQVQESQQLQELEKSKDSEESASKELAKEAAQQDQENQDKETLEKEAKDLANAAAVMAEANSDPDSQEAQKEANDRIGEEQKEENKVSENTSTEKEAVKETFQSSEKVTALTENDFGTGKNVGRWFVLFTTHDCQHCESLGSKWENHERFANDIQGINWGRVDCDAYSELCDKESVFTFPALRIYQDGTLMYNYKGSTDSLQLRKFVNYASSATSFEGFSLSDLDTNLIDTISEHQPQDGNQEPNYIEGPVVSKPKYTSDPKIQDVVEYTLSTLGQPIDEDPGRLIFGDSPEAHHNFRTWGAPDAPPPPFVAPGTAASQAQGKVIEFGPQGLERLVKGGSEPWIVKFYSPKCSFCESMASEYETLAKNLKGKLNVGALNCEMYADVCAQEKIDHWPYIRLYRDSTTTLEEYTGARTALAMGEYAEQVWGAQIHPVENADELGQEIVKNLDKGLTTFVYLYDKSVMAEDWESLSMIAVKIDSWGGKLYRSNNDELRESAGIKHRGTAFVNVDLIGEPGEGSLKWYDYPWSNIPKRIRDPESVVSWAYRAKFTQLQYLDPISQTKFSPYIAVVLTVGNTAPSKDQKLLSHKQKALELRDYYRERQIKDQDQVRIDRLNQHDAALLESKFAYARSLMKQQIDIPMFTDLSFAYIPYDIWVSEYSNYIDTTSHEVGNIIVCDFYNGIYIDRFNNVPIKDDRDVLDGLVEFLHLYEDRDTKTIFTSLRHFKRSYKGIPKPLHRSTHFHSKSADGFFVVLLWRTFKTLGYLIFAYIVFKSLVRPCLRRFTTTSNRRYVKDE